MTRTLVIDRENLASRDIINEVKGRRRSTVKNVPIPNAKCSITDCKTPLASFTMPALPTYGLPCSTLIAVKE